MSKSYTELLQKLDKLDINSNIYFQKDNKSFNELLNVIKSSKGLYAISRIIKTNAKLMQWINDMLPLLKDEQYDLKTKLHWILFNVADFPRCDNEKCNKPILKNVFKLIN